MPQLPLDVSAELTRGISVTTCFKKNSFREVN
uniref:Uncharacterized protein n=1 Tax=Anguilla anguilla TaxID=7936 RepID=A0A0E9R2N6_ANGAN